MSFLNASDYRAIISPEHLIQLITDEAVTDKRVLEKAESVAITKVKDRLRGKFDLALLFMQIRDYDPVVLYLAGSYVWHDDGILYEAIQDVKGILPSDLNGADYWKESDPRNITLVNMLIIIALYEVHKRISPDKIPELRKDDYKEAMEQLENISNFKIDADFPKLPDTLTTATKPAFISQPKQNWFF